MGIIVRPNKAVGGGGGPSWLSNVDLYGSELDADIVPLYTEINGNLDATNLKANAGIPGSMFADNSIPATKYGDLSIAGGKVANDTFPASKLKIDIFTIANLGAYGANEFKSFECTGVLSTTHKFISRMFKIPGLLVSADMSNVFPFYENEMQIDTATNKFWLHTKAVSVPLNLTGWGVDIIFIEST